MMFVAGGVIFGCENCAGPSVEDMFRPMAPGKLAFDIGLASVCWLLGALAFTNGVFGNVFVLTGMAFALALRRVSPGLALAIAWATAILQVGFGIGPEISNLAILPVLYATASYGTPLLRWLGLGSAGAGACVAAGYLSLQSVLNLYELSGWGGSSLLTELTIQLPRALLQFLLGFFVILVVFVLSWTLGLLAKTWRESREVSLARIIAERERIDAERSVTIEQERNRLARDMHDVVAHSLAVVIAQADGARYAGTKDRTAVDAALTTIASTAREALGDVRILLGQLRHAQGDAPQPVLDDFGRLFEQFRISGLSVDFDEWGTPWPLAAGAQLAVFRIVQESLTNALRHSDSSRGATVSIRWANDEIALEIVSRLDGALTPQPSSGHGIAGMAERAALASGTFSAKPEGERFTVSATIPRLSAAAHEAVTA